VEKKGLAKKNLLREGSIRRGVAPGASNFVKGSRGGKGSVRAWGGGSRIEGGERGKSEAEKDNLLIPLLVCFLLSFVKNEIWEISALRGQGKNQGERAFVFHLEGNGGGRGCDG